MTKNRMVLIAVATGLGVTLGLLALLTESGSPLERARVPDAAASEQVTSAAGLDPAPPTLPVRLVFIHHSTGNNWLGDSLRAQLNANRYFVVDSDYGWGPNDLDVGSGTIGDHTDIGHWYNWFVGPHRDTYMNALYTTNNNSSLNRGVANPGGQNEIVMLKSCFPNSHLGGSPNDPPTTGSNPLRGQPYWTTFHTVANAKGIYNDLLTYFATRQDKLFVVISAPPLVQGETDATEAANARAFNKWLINDWLDNYPYNNVAVFDFYNVLTTNGGNPNTNDLNRQTGNHHRYRGGAIEYITNQGTNYAAYGTSSADSHPTAAGNEKATFEFLQLLNISYHRWQGGDSVKKASIPAPKHGEMITFTIVVRGLPAPPTTSIQLTDVVPTGLAFVPGSLRATSGIVTATAPTLRWSGLLSPTPAVTITYGVTVTAVAIRAITNTAQIVAPGFRSITLSAMIVANGYSTHLPVIKRE